MMMLTTAWRLLLLLTLLTGGIYPLVMTGFAQWCFPWQANGSLHRVKGQVIGSHWIGQEFNSNDYFFGRPSATAHGAYNGLASGGSNLGPSNPALVATVQARIAQRNFLRLPIPVDLVTASASGLDPEISPAAAYYQIDRIAFNRHISPNRLRQLIQVQTQNRTFGILGEPRINVLMLNLALDAMERP